MTNPKNLMRAGLVGTVLSVSTILGTGIYENLSKSPESRLMHVIDKTIETDNRYFDRINPVLEQMKNDPKIQEETQKESKLEYIMGFATTIFIASAGIFLYGNIKNEYIKKY